MADEARIKELQEGVMKQAEIVREMKGNKATKEQLKKPVEELKRLKGELEAIMGSTSNKIVDRGAVEDLLKRRFFIAPAFAIYGGVKGLYDFGPPGCALKTNFLSYWRQFFVLEENMLEVDGPCLTPHSVLATSGHVEKFTDFMVKELVAENPEFFRADHLLEDRIDELLTDTSLAPETVTEYKSIQAQVDNYDAQELGEMLKRFEVVSPNGHPISAPEPFNLMFATQIGPTGLYPGFMRPETAQGIFVNFRRLLEYNGGKMPFAAAQIGQAFRNEISPRAGLLRVREFTLAEIEHFVNPQDKSHTKFASIRETKLNLFPQSRQLMVQGPQSISIGEAVDTGMVNCEALGYFLARTHIFLTKCGIPNKHLRFRQHLVHEMAHYAKDCWDAEIETSYGWVEVVGHADRACYDLSSHAKATKTNMDARTEFEKPRQVVSHEFQANKAMMGKAFKKQNKDVMENLENMSEEERIAAKATLEKEGKLEVKICTGESFTVTSEMLTIERSERTVQSESFTPSVIEPSFGVGRILYGILEHAYYLREGGDEQRAVLRFSPHIAPVKCSVLPLMIKPDLMSVTQQVASQLTLAGVSTKIESAGVSIGRRYARTDEIGVPFGVTIDMQTIDSASEQANTVTLRERDSMAQVRLPIADVAGVVAALCSDRMEWADCLAKYPAQAAVAEK